MMNIRLGRGIELHESGSIDTTICANSGSHYRNDGGANFLSTILSLSARTIKEHPKMPYTNYIIRPCLDWDVDNHCWREDAH